MDVLNSGLGDLRVLSVHVRNHETDVDSRAARLPFRPEVQAVIGEEDHTLSQREHRELQVRALHPEAQLVAVESHAHAYIASEQLRDDRTFFGFVPIVPPLDATLPMRQA